MRKTELVNGVRGIYFQHNNYNLAVNITISLHILT